MSQEAFNLNNCHHSLGILNRVHYRRKEIVSGGHDKENLFERHYFLRLQHQFPEKWGDTCPPSPPGSYGTGVSFKIVSSERIRLSTFSNNH